MRLLFVIYVLLFTACTKKSANVVKDPVQEGRRLFSTHCTACHNVNPKIDGAIGPAVAGSSMELLEFKVLKGEYPPGYAAKRATKTMVPLPFLKDQLPALHSFLNTP